MRVAPILAFSAALTACAAPPPDDGAEGEGEGCTGAAQPSVRVTVTMDDQPASEASATMQPLDDVESPCRDTVEPGVFECGYDLAGEITVRASNGPVSSTDEETVTVEEDDASCHVITREVALELFGFG